MIPLIPCKIESPTFEEFAKFFGSSMGPMGHFKIFITSAAALRLTCTSERIIQCLEESIDSNGFPVCRLILQAGKSHLLSHGDSGLFFMCLLCGLLSCEIPAKVTDPFEIPKAVICEALEEAKIKVDISNVRQILSVVETILGSKNLMSVQQVKQHSTLIVQAFLLSMNEDVTKVMPVTIKAKQRGDFLVELVHGYTIPLPDSWSFKKELLERFSPNEPVKIAILNVQIKTDVSELSQITSLNGVKIVQIKNLQFVSKKGHEQHGRKFDRFLREKWCADCGQSKGLTLFSLPLG